MRSATKARHPAAPADLSAGNIYSYPAMVSPNSSAILTLTVLATLEEVLAVLCTAVLFAKTLKSQLSIDLPDKETVVVEAEDLYAASQLGLVDAARTYLQEPAFSNGSGFVLETNFTAATFISAGNISVHIRTAGPAADGSHREVPVGDTQSR